MMRPQPRCFICGSAVRRVDGGQVDRDDRVPALRRELLDRGGELDAGVVDEDVDPAEFGRRVPISALIWSGLLMSAPW